MLKKILLVLSIFALAAPAHSNSIYLLGREGCPDTLNSEIGLEELWQELQKAETLLIQTSRGIYRERARKIFQNVNLESPFLVLLLRMTFGLNNDGFSADDYNIRYPFSSKKLIQSELDTLVELGFVGRVHASGFRITDRGLDITSHYMNETGAMIQALNLAEISEREVNAILELDHKILNALVSNEGEHGSPILKNRMGGLQPDYNEIQLWHHWQIIWSMLAALEDEQEHFRKSIKMNPFVWYIRRNLWFISQKPWLGGPQSIEDFIHHFNNYAPVEYAEEKIEESVRAMELIGWVEINKGKLVLTEEGLNEHDEDERQVMRNFFKRWPEISQETIKPIYNTVSGLNRHLQAMNEQHRE